MRINLGCGNDMRIGFVNVDKLPMNGPPELCRQGDIKSIDWLAEDGTVEEIIAIDCLEYLPLNSVQPAITNWASKLATNGVLKILVPDCFAIAKAFSQGQFSLGEFCQMLFGTQQQNDARLSAIDLDTLVKILGEAGLVVSVKRYEGVAVYVEATKC